MTSLRSLKSKFTGSASLSAARRERERLEDARHVLTLSNLLSDVRTSNAPGGRKKWHARAITDGHVKIGKAFVKAHYDPAKTKDRVVNDYLNVCCLQRDPKERDSVEGADRMFRWRVV